MDELLFQNATEDVADGAADLARKRKGAAQMWESMDNCERLELEQLRAAAPPFGRRSPVQAGGFGRRAGVALALCPSQRAQMRDKPVNLAGFAKR